MRYLIFLAFLALSCQSLKHGQVNKRHTQFGINAPQGWLEKSFRGADLFYEHESKKAAIFVNAECDRVSDSPLEVLTNQLLVGLNNINHIKQERFNLADREALVSEITAYADGVKRYIKIMVLKKNRCVYDAVFNSAPEQAHLAAGFDELVKSFWAEAEL